MKSTARTKGQDGFTDLVSDLKQLQLALRLPFLLTFEGQEVVSFPQPAPRPALNGKQPLLDLLPFVAGHPHIPQHLKSPYAERFIYLELEAGWSLLGGPFLYPDDVVSVEQQVRQGLYSIQEREAAAHSLAELPRLDYDAAIAVGRVAAEHFRFRRLRREFPYDSRPRQKVPPPERGDAVDLATPLPDNYYRIQIQERSGHYVHPSIRLEAELAGCIERGDEENALSVLRRLNRLERARLADNPLRSLKNSLIGSMTIFARAAINGGVPDNTAFTLSDAYIRQIEAAGRADELEGLEERAIRAFVNFVREENEQRYSFLILQLMHYIDLHLTSELSLPILARKVHLHPNYLSARFRRETGQRLSEYIREKRLQEAAHMIRYTNNSLKEIAAFYRFHSQSHFSRLFKQYFQMTPSSLAQRKKQTS